MFLFTCPDFGYVGTKTSTQMSQAVIVIIMIMLILMLMVNGVTVMKLVVQNFSRSVPIL